MNNPAPLNTIRSWYAKVREDYGSIESYPDKAEVQLMLDKCKMLVEVEDTAKALLDAETLTIYNETSAAINNRFIRELIPHLEYRLKKAD